MDELREMLGRRDVVQGTFFVIEDTIGEVRGCCVLRGARLEAEFAEIVIVFGNDDYYASPLAEEVFRFLARNAFVDKKLNKMCAHCLSAEEPYRRLLVAHGFRSDGVQRDMVYTKGRYFDLESLSLFQRDAHPEDLRGNNGTAVAAT